MYELFVPLSSGGRVILVENAMGLSSLSAEARVTLVNTVPSAIAELLRRRRIPDSVVTVNLAGEPLSPELADAIYRQTRAKQVYDLYGPSEATTYSTYTLRLPEGPATIGRPNRRHSGVCPGQARASGPGRCAGRAIPGAPGWHVAT